MKINWGTGLAIGMALFVIFILQFVIRISVQDKYDNELVTENYYEKEMVFQNQIDGTLNAQKLKNNISSRRTEEGYLLTFPKEFNPKNISGTLALYRPSNKKLDYEQELELTKSEYLIPKENLVPGHWDIIISWQHKGEEYFYKERINY